MKCVGCDGALIFHSEVMLPNFETVRLCGTCIRRIRELDATTLQYSDPRHPINLRHDMPAETRSRFVPGGVPLSGNFEQDLLGQRGAVTMQERKPIERTHCQARDLSKISRNWPRHRVAK